MEQFEGYSESTRKATDKELHKMKIKIKSYSKLFGRNHGVLLFMSVLSILFFFRVAKLFRLDMISGLIVSVVIGLGYFILVVLIPMLKELKALNKDMVDKEVHTVDLHVELIKDLPYKKAIKNPLEEDGHIFFIHNPYGIKDYLYDREIYPELNQAKKIRYTYAKHSKFGLRAEVLE